MRTDWGGSSDGRAPGQRAVPGHRGRFAERLRANNDGAASDPAKVAQVLLRVADMEQPPLRLLLAATPSPVRARSRRAAPSATRSSGAEQLHDHRRVDTGHLCALKKCRRGSSVEGQFRRLT